MIDSECDSLDRWGGLPVITLPGRGFKEMGDWPGEREIPAWIDGALRAGVAAYSATLSHARLHATRAR